MYRSAIIFSLLFLFVSCGTKTTTEKILPSQWEDFGYLPYNTESLIYLNPDNLKKLNYPIEKFVGRVQEDSSNSWISKFEEETGIGLNKGVEEIIIAVAEDGQNVFLVRFDDNHKKVRDYFNKSPVFSKNEMGDKEIFTLKQNPSAQMYFPNKSILLFSKGKSLFRSLITDKGKRLKDNDNFMSIIKNIKSKHNVWIASDKGTVVAELFNQLAGKNSKLLSPKILSSINNFSLSTEFSGDIQVESVMDCSSPGNAYLLASAVEGAVTMKIISRKDERLGRIFNKMDIKREGELIRFHVELTEKDLNDLKSLTKNNNQVNKY